MKEADGGKTCFMSLNLRFVETRFNPETRVKPFFREGSSYRRGDSTVFPTQLILF